MLFQTVSLSFYIGIPIDEATYGMGLGCDPSRVKVWRRGGKEWYRRRALTGGIMMADLYCIRHANDDNRKGED